MANIHFTTQGCSANATDSELMAGYLQQADHVIVDNPEDADLFIFNSCTVKSPTENAFKNHIKQLEQTKKPIIIAGCIPQSERDISQFKKHSLIGTYQVSKINEVVEKTLLGETVTKLERKHTSPLNVPKKRINEHVEIVPILQGCLSSCNFCKTKHARGNAYSYDKVEIVRHISNAVKTGAKEIWLTSQDNGAYGHNQGTNLPNLLKDIISIPQEFKLRIGMANPEHFLKFLPQLIEVMKSDKIYNFIHIPVQAGNNQVLSDMNRKYTVEEYIDTINTLEKEIPNITIATDIICGYPTESEEQFMDTYNLIKKTRPDVINISRFWPRPGTVAAKLPPLDHKIVKDRTKRLMELHHQISKEIKQQEINTAQEILITEIETKQNQHNIAETQLVGRNSAYKKVILKLDNKELLGEKIKVKIIDANTFHLIGKINQSA